VDRRKPGSKHHLIVDGGGIPLASILTAANRHDVTQLLPLVEAIPPVAGKPGAPLKKPQLLVADRGYDSDPHRQHLRDQNIAPLIARRNTQHGSGLGVLRWVAEQTISLFHQFRHLRIRVDKRDDIHEAFMSLACGIMCWRRFHNLCGYI
jgi:IS5 family transposase